MTSRTLGSTTALVEPEPPLNLADEIRARAYELYEQRGREHGNDVEDWLRAEKEIKEIQALIAAVKAIASSIDPQPRVRSNGGSFVTST